MNARPTPLEVSRDPAPFLREVRARVQRGYRDLVGPARRRAAVRDVWLLAEALAFATDATHADVTVGELEAPPPAEAPAFPKPVREPRDVARGAHRRDAGGGAAASGGGLRAPPPPLLAQAPKEGRSMTSNVAESLQTETVVLLPLDQCHKSPTQPRRRDDKKPDDDFVSSIKAKGVIQPVVVRDRKAGGWEIVFGHRRHAGSVLAGRETIPAIVRDMSDDEVFEAQLIENVHRADMHPLDEADGFKRMLDRKRTVAQIAEKIGRPIAYVAQRLKLCELVKEARAALDKEEISLGVAVLLARIPAALQAEALKSLWHGANASQAKRQLEEKYLLRLDQAPFDVGDAKLVAAAGACTACPKRTGQQRELFPDAARADLCIDPICYRSKLDAVWQIRVKEAKAGGTAVLEGKEAQKALSMAYGGGTYRKLDDEEWDGKKHRKVRALLGKDLPPVTLARDERTGAIAELVKTADVNKVLKKPAPSADRYNAQTGLHKSQEVKERRRAIAVGLAIAQAVENVSKLGHADLVRLMVHALVERSWNEVQMAVLRRREPAGKDGKKKSGGAGAGAEERLLKYFRSLTKPSEVAGLGLELALGAVAPAKWNPAKPLWGETLKALGIKFEAIEKQVADEAKAKKKAKPAKGRAAA